MMRILCCVKRVPAPGAKINIANDGLAVDTAHLGFTTSPHEECGVEEAIQLVERYGGEVTVLTLGPPEATEQLRYAASVGAHHGVLVPTNGADWDPQRTAQALTTAIETLESSDGVFDLILFGNESADSGGFQVGVRVAHALKRPIVNGIKGIEIIGIELDADTHVDADTHGTTVRGVTGVANSSIGGASVRARREIDGGFEVYEMKVPVALGVKEGINLPRYPTMRGRLASRRLKITTIDIDAEPGGQQLVRLHPPKESVSETMILGHGPESVPAVVDVLQELGVL